MTKTIIDEGKDQITVSPAAGEDIEIRIGLAKPTRISSSKARQLAYALLLEAERVCGPDYERA